MADITLTALDLAEQRQNSAAAAATRAEPARAVETPTEDGARQVSAISVQAELVTSTLTNLELTKSELTEPELAKLELEEPKLVEPAVLPGEPPMISTSLPVLVPELLPAPVSESISVPEAMLRVQKCATCGFPVSEGRTLCLDCERKNDNEKKEVEKQRKKEAGEIKQNSQEQGVSSEAASPTTEEFVPAFLANAKPVNESWFANHVNLLAIVVLILCVLVAVVVFR
jgi:hypothetical protein